MDVSQAGDPPSPGVSPRSGGEESGSAHELLAVIVDPLHGVDQTDPFGDPGDGVPPSVVGEAVGLPWVHPANPAIPVAAMALRYSRRLARSGSPSLAFSSSG